MARFDTRKLLLWVPLSATFAIASLCISPQATAQSADIMFLARRSYTTSASIFPNPSALSATVRNEHTLVEGVTGFAGEIQVPIANSEFLLGLSIEYLSYVDEGEKAIALGGVPRNLPVRDGFFVLPVELHGIVNIPLQSETFRLLMAGGGGVYFADRILDVAGVGVRSTSTTLGFGIHVSISLEYRILPGLWLHGETRFRDPDITLEYVYEKVSTVYQGVTLPFSTAPMQTRVNLDGMSLSAGLMLQIPRIFGQ